MTLALRTRLDDAPAADALFMPGLAGLEGPDLDLLALMPVCDVNGALAEALEGRAPWTPGAAPVVGLFLLDPFLRVNDMAAALRRAGIGRVANYPTIQGFDGEAARSLASVGFSPAAELEALRAFAALGFSTVGFAAGAAAARELAAAGAEAVVLHPGPGGGEEARDRGALAAMAAWLRPELAAGGVRLLAFAPREGLAREI